MHKLLLNFECEIVLTKMHFQNAIFYSVVWEDSKYIITGVLLVSAFLIALIFYWHCGATKNREFDISEARKFSQQILHQDRNREMFRSRRSNLIRIVSNESENTLEIVSEV